MPRVKDMYRYKTSYIHRGKNVQYVDKEKGSMYHYPICSFAAFSIAQLANLYNSETKSATTLMWMTSLTEQS